MGLHRVEKLDNSSVDQILPFLYTFVFLSSLCVQPTNQKLLWINQQWYNHPSPPKPPPAIVVVTRVITIVFDSWGIVSSTSTTDVCTLTTIAIVHSTPFTTSDSHCTSTPIQHRVVRWASPPHQICAA
ncbi:hypothetical protein GmHk_15G043345 [Glycine max]|uniref:Uncharacterized protein n=2 Tax=Glycine subgen. Soja TaxID=1462606 RepID=A0A0R0G7Q4_SOYBN|nr:hypothetical protein JHK87_041881 [Glycine soja]KAH1208574.1 hypothetical protein GmHk_15G043345 [Glycine max]RZB63990.1 hypothetical protein D0Y65_040518 [Glycine soja]